MCHNGHVTHTTLPRTTATSTSHIADDARLGLGLQRIKRERVSASSLQALPLLLPHVLHQRTYPCASADPLRLQAPLRDPPCSAISGHRPLGPWTNPSTSTSPSQRKFQSHLGVGKILHNPRKVPRHGEHVLP